VKWTKFFFFFFLRFLCVGGGCARSRSTELAKIFILFLLGYKIKEDEMRL